MEERLTVDDENLLMSSIRTGTPLAPKFRDEFALNTKALLGHAKSYLETCHHLADACLVEIAQYDDTIGPDWKRGVVEEIQWWWTWINKLRRQNELQNWAKLRGLPFPFERDCAAFGNQALCCLNIGCGPRPNLGEATDYDVEIIHMDPLASAYNRLMDFLDAPGGGDVVFGAVEILDQLDTGKFHFIAAKNCLDHAYDVPGGLRQMIDVLEDRGVIALEHYENEAEAQNYLGFHKWNIEIVEGQIHIWSRSVSEVFDHSAYGFELSYEKKVVHKAGGQPHPMLNIRLTRGLAD
ncbi:MAG: methyltransferase domain-containing protein [Paracoccaceae bacterium]